MEKVKQLTAVQWLRDKILKSSTEEIVANIHLWFDRAEEAEKQYIIKAYKRESCYMKHAGCTDEQINQSAENYYNKTFKTE